MSGSNRFLFALLLVTSFLAISQPAFTQSNVDFHFESILSNVDISSVKVAHVTRAATIIVDAGRLSELDWGLWYQGRTVTISRANDSNGRLGFIYPTSDSEPSRPNLRVIFATPVEQGQAYSFSYEFDVSSPQGQMSWSETFDVSAVRVKSLSIVIALPAGFVVTGVQPSDAKTQEQSGRTQVRWVGTNLSEQPSVGLTVGFESPSSVSYQAFSLTSLLPYAGAAAALGSLALYTVSRIRSSRRRGREPELILEMKAKEAAGQALGDVTPTGLQVLDYLLNGGLPNKSASLLTAPVCDERDALLRRFLQTGAKADCYTVYLGKDVSKIEDLTALYPSSLKALLVGARVGGEATGPNIRTTTKLENLTAVNIDLASVLQASQGASKRLFIDVLDDLLLVHKSLVARKWLGQLIQRAKDLGYTVLASLNSQMHSQAEIQALVDLFGGHIEILERDFDGKPRRVIRVRKMSRWKFLDTEALLDRDKLTT